MSIRIMAKVWDVDLPDSEKIVLLALADCANDEGHCWPGMRSLERKCSKSDRTIQTSIKSLVDKGHMTRREVPGKGCNYTIHPRSAFAPEAASPPKGTTQTPEAASGKPSRTVSTSRAKALSVSRGATSFDEMMVAEGIKGLAPIEWGEWAVKNMHWRSGEATMEVQRFVDSCKAHDRRYKDWMAAWRNWCRSPYCKTKAAGSDGYVPNYLKDPSEPMYV